MLTILSAKCAGRLLIAAIVSNNAISKIAKRSDWRRANFRGRAVHRRHPNCQPLYRSIRLGSLLVSAMSACSFESTSAARVDLEEASLNGPTPFLWCGHIQARHTARLNVPARDECPLYGPRLKKGAGSGREARHGGHARRGVELSYCLVRNGGIGGGYHEPPLIFRGV